MSIILKILPAALIRWFGRAQFQYPALRPVILAVSGLLVRSGAIQRGPGKGLLIDATGSKPGYLAGTSEVAEQEIIIKNLKPGDVFYDVGANIGFYAIIAARYVTTTGHVYAFEPTPNLAHTIRKNAKLNSMSQITVIESAVCEKDGTLQFQVGNEMSTTNRIGSPDPSMKSIEVSATTIDSFSATHPKPDMILIDIEGSEMDALRGALETIQSHLPILLVEVHWLGQAFTDFYESNLKSLGYSISTYQGTPVPDGPIRYHAILKASPSRS